MDDKSEPTKGKTGQRTSGFGMTRRAALAASMPAALSFLSGCSAIDDLLDSGSDQVVGTRASAPAGFYPGRPPASVSDSGDSDDTQFFATGQTDINEVPATVRAEGQKIDLEGWSYSVPTKAQDYNSSRSNKPSTEWWAGPGDDDNDGDGLPAVQDIELELLGHVMTAHHAVEQRAPEEVSSSLDAFIDATMEELRPELDRCEIDVCAAIRESSDGRIDKIRSAVSALDDGDWDRVASELAAVEEVVLGDIERLDDELEERRPGRPRFSDLIAYLRDEPTIGERFTVSLPDASLPGDRGSLADQLTPERVLSYFAASTDDGGRHTPFHNRYRPRFTYDDRGCIQTDGPVSLHEDLGCQNILSAKLDTYTTENRAIVGSSTDGSAVVSSTPATVDTDAKVVFVAADGTLREPLSQDGGDVQCWGQNRAADNGDVRCWGQNRSAGEASVSSTLVCPVTVTLEDSPTPLPGLFYVRRIIHDEQLIFVGGWMLDEGSLYEDSATLLFEEGPTEVASVTPEDIESDDYDDRIVEQFSRDRSRYGSMVISSTPEAVAESGSVPKAQLTSKLDSLLGVGDGDSDGDGLSDVSVTALDAPLVHLAGATELSDQEKKRYKTNGFDGKGNDVVSRYLSIVRAIERDRTEVA